MQVESLLIEEVGECQVLREDDHGASASAYLEVHPRNFEFSHYDHGTPALKEKYHITKHLFRYFNKRKFLFSRFEEGIAIDAESWYSVIPQSVSLYLRERFLSTKVKSIFEPFSGVGGIAIHLCDYFQEYIVNDIDSKKLKMLQNNMRVYEKGLNRLKFINSDFLKVEPFRTDALIICPPWGGIDTSLYASTDPDELMTPKLSEILVHGQRFSNNIMLQMPKQTDIRRLISIFRKVGLAPIFTVEKIMTNGKCSQLFFYLGAQNFVQMDKSHLFNRLYKDLHIDDKQDKKRARQHLTEQPQEVLRQVYRQIYPQKKSLIKDENTQIDHEP